MEMVVNSGMDVIALPDEAAFEACDTSSATTLHTARSWGAVNFRYTINIPGTYYLSSNVEGNCAAGQKLKVIVEGSKLGDQNGQVAEVIFAPAAHANPGNDDDFTAFGKGVFHTKAYDDELHTPCKSGTCLDRKESRGSCYYSGEDFHIGHAVFCDVSEEECCGYFGCSSRDNRAKFLNGTAHGYYWYAPGYLSRGACCHCLAGCDRSKENETLASGGVCKYRDITSDDCQRNEKKDDMSYDSVGFLSCPFAAAKSIADTIVREKVQKATTPPDSSTPPGSSNTPPDSATPPDAGSPAARPVATAAAVLALAVGLLF